MKYKDIEGDRRIRDPEEKRAAAIKRHERSKKYELIASQADKDTLNQLHAEARATFPNNRTWRDYNPNDMTVKVDFATRPIERHNPFGPETLMAKGLANGTIVRRETGKGTNHPCYIYHANYTD